MKSKFLMASLLAVSTVFASETLVDAPKTFSERLKEVSARTQTMMRMNKKPLDVAPSIDGVETEAVSAAPAVVQSQKVKPVEAPVNASTEKSSVLEKAGRFATLKKAVFENPRTSTAVAAVCVVGLSVAVYKLVQAKKAKKQAFLEELEEFEVIL